ncbi:MAG: hypothetical protein KF794_14125 [Xanthobacteraceae bacterium]|nr:hypothetical protein [Xanthobacteraceae bacterium]QYK44872.1 MAG: hypothetical protein KF794_14125 [Xanthobacteraceae bacterium]
MLVAMQAFRKFAVGSALMFAGVFLFWLLMMAMAAALFALLFAFSALGSIGTLPRYLLLGTFLAVAAALIYGVIHYALLYGTRIWMRFNANAAQANLPPAE